MSNFLKGMIEDEIRGEINKTLVRLYKLNEIEKYEIDMQDIMLKQLERMHEGNRYLTEEETMNMLVEVLEIDDPLLIMQYVRGEFWWRNESSTGAYNYLVENEIKIGKGVNQVKEKMKQMVLNASEETIQMMFGDDGIDDRFFEDDYGEVIFDKYRTLEYISSTINEMPPEVFSSIAMSIKLITSEDIIRGEYSLFEYLEGKVGIDDVVELAMKLGEIKEDIDAV